MNNVVTFVNELYANFWNSLNADAMPQYYNKDATWHVGNFSMSFDEMRTHVSQMKESTLLIQQNIHKIVHSKKKISIWYNQRLYNHDKELSDQFNTITTLSMNNDKIQRVHFIWDKPEKTVIDTFSKVVSPPSLPETKISKILSRRELQIFYYLIQGNTAKLIAERLSISPRTVDSHILAIKTKTGLPNIKQITEYAIEHGYLSLSPIFTSLFEEV
jgi:DNA-binding CsgD family transcriptional regulator